MKLNIEQALQQGVAAHNAGNLQEAERAYQAILHSQPDHPDANHNLGLIAVSMDQVEAALPLFKTALNANPNIEQFWVSYIDALVIAKHLKDAKQAIKKAKKKGFDAKKLQALFSKSKVNADTNVPPQQQLSSLLEYYQTGQYGDAEKLAKSITQQFPQHQFAWKVLGAVLKQTGRITDSLTPMQKSVQLMPQDAGAQNNLGTTLQELGRFDEAEACYKQAIVSEPDLAEAHYNLGTTLQKLGRFDEAEACYKQAIVLQPDYVDAHYNLGITLHDMGRFDEAEASYNQAIALKPDYAEAMFNISITQSYMNNLEAEIVSLQNVLRIDSDDYGLRAGVNLAICNFLKGDFAESKKFLLAAAKIQEKTSSASENERVYWRYLSNILKWRENKYISNKKEKNDKNLYVLGESHSLASHHLRIQYSKINFFCSARLIKGCKQWHLGNAFRNQYKHQFESVFCVLPKHSYVLLAIGEIDCRLETGIIAHKKKFPKKQLKEIILTTVENYLAYIVNNNSDCQHKVIIQGVPCPNIDVRSCSQKDIKQLVEVIKIFNYELKVQSKEKGFRFLDTYQLTNKGDGLSNGFWHIDDYHLSPEGMQEAWRRYSAENR